MIPDPDIAAALASMVAQAGGGGIDWDKVWQLVTTLAAGGIAYLAATYKSRHEAKAIQGGELSKATEVLIGGWESMTERQQAILSQVQAEAMAAAVRASGLQRELDEMRQRYQQALHDLAELQRTARRKRPAISAGD